LDAEVIRREGVHVPGTTAVQSVEPGWAKFGACRHPVRPRALGHLFSEPATFAKRIGELKELFADVKSGLVFVTAFLDRRTFVRYLAQIAWQTEVWIAESPGNLVHFDGERFLGPYDSPEL